MMLEFKTKESLIEIAHKNLHTHQVVCPTEASKKLINLQITNIIVNIIKTNNFFSFTQITLKYHH